MDVFVLALLAGATMLAHGWSLGDGLFLDDHWHQVQLRDRGWSWSDLLETTTIDPAEFMEIWWQEQPIRWQYARPVSVLLMKAVYHLTGGHVAAQHFVSIALHFTNACLVYLLCLWLTERRFWATVGGLLFVIYSHSVFAVGWLAAQNTLLQTALMMAAMLIYVRASGLRLGTGTLAAPRGVDVVPPLRSGLFSGVVALWILAVLARENALMLPGVLAAMDLAFGGRRHAWQRRWGYGLMGALTIAFLVWRLGVFYHPMPSVYFRQPIATVSYAIWALIKLMHYLCSAVWLSPMTVGPTGRLDPLAEVPGDCLLMLAILAVMGTGYVLACRHAKGYWIWPLWLVLSFLPVVPVLATPHSGYLAGVGFAVAMVLGPGLRDRIRPVSIGRWSAPVAIWFLIATSTYIPIYRTLWRGMLATEKYTIAKMTAGPAPKDVSDIFFINAPFVNIYSKLCLEKAWGEAVRDVRCHVLTYAPNLLRMDDRCEVTQIDARRFYLSVEGDPYFSGLLGRYLIDSVRPSGRLRTGDHVAGALFDVEVVEAGDQGVRKLLFTFAEPLASEKYRFYLTSRDCPAAPLRFLPPEGPPSMLSDTSGGSAARRRLALSTPSADDVEATKDRLYAGDADAAEVLFSGMRSEDEAVRRLSWTAFQPVALPLARAQGSMVDDLLTGEAPSAADLPRITAWWANHVDDVILDELWLQRHDFETLRVERDAVFNIRRIAGTIIQSDLYMTGPPFPGPR